VLLGLVLLLLRAASGSRVNPRQGCHCMLDADEKASIL
jgi:hypothetical protein